LLSALDSGSSPERSPDTTPRDYNSKVASWKVAYLGPRRGCTASRSAFIVSIAMLVGVYAVVQANQSTGMPATLAATTTSTTLAERRRGTTGTATTSIR
jgi:hypothetical protein